MEIKPILSNYILMSHIYVSMYWAVIMMSANDRLH